MHSLLAASYLYVEIPDLMYNNDNQTTYSANYSNVNVIWHHNDITKNISVMSIVVCTEGDCASQLFTDLKVHRHPSTKYQYTS